MRLPVLLGVALVAAAVRLLGSAWIGPGPFGPDGPGIEAAVALGGHPYPGHPWLVALVGDQRLTSVLGGVVAAMATGWLCQRLGGRLLSGGLLAACAPLFVLVSVLDGGDAAALGVAALGIALAASGRPLLGGLVALLALGVKPVVAPALVVLAITPLLAERRLRHTLLLVAGSAAGLALVHGTLDPLLRPREASGILGSWFMATHGAVPTLAQLPQLTSAGFERLLDLPSWTGHPALGGTALIGAFWPGRHRRVRIALLLLAAGTMLATSTLLGDRLEGRWLAGASLPLVALAGVALKRVPWVAFLFGFVGLAFVDHVAAERDRQDPGTASPIGLLPDRWDARPTFEASSICNASQLRALHTELLDHPGPVTVQPLHDGREGELTWPLQAARPDLEIHVTSDAPLVHESAPCVYSIR